MAESAILADRSVLPQIRSAFFGVALVTGVIDVQSCQLRRNGVAVHVVAAHAVHLSFEYRVRESLLRLSALHPMAAETDVGLRRRLPDGIRRRVEVVTVDTSYLVAGVSARVPAETDIALVAGQAHAVLFVDRRSGIRTEPNHGGAFLSAPDTARMRASWSVAGLALQLVVTKRPVRVRRCPMLGVKQAQDLGISMTRNAGIRTFAAVLYFLAVCRLHRYKEESGKRYSLYKQFHLNHPLVKSIKEKSANTVYFFHVKCSSGTVANHTALDA
jgi:hypothetical protein